MGRFRTVISLLLVGILTWSGCSGIDDQALAPPEPSSPGDDPGGRGGGAGPLPAAGTLTTFDRCGPLLDHLQETAASRIDAGGWAWGGDAMVLEDNASAAEPSARAEGGEAGGPPVEGQDFSGTNVQEGGVDEPDVVKTDGDTMFVARAGELVSVDADGTAGVLDRIEIAAEGHGGELLLVGDRVLVLSTRWGSPTATTAMTSVDVSDPADLRLVDEIEVEGEYRTARLVDGTARVVLQSGGPRLHWAYPEGPGQESSAKRRNQELLEETSIEDWLPHQIVDGDRKPLVGCDAVHVPADFAGAGMVSVLTLPLTGTGPVEPRTTTVAATADTVYASTTSLYIASHTWPAVAEPATTRSPQPVAGSTDLHRFDITGDSAVHVASGSVPGAVLNQYSLSEHEDRLRVATTEGPMWSAPAQAPPTTSSVRVLEQHGDRLEEIGVVGDLGRGETIRSVRFVGDTAYVVTFRQTDPFYVVDLADPTAPQVTGELKLPGYSGYLHPIDDTHVLGVGQEGDADGRLTGVKVSLFDVGDPARPVETAQWVLDGGHQSVEFDARAFLYWPATGLAVVPMEAWAMTDLAPSDPGFAGAVGLAVGDGSITELGRISHPQQPGAKPGLCPDDPTAGACPDLPTAFAPPIERSLVVGDRLWTLSPAGLLASDLRSLQAGAFVALS